VSFLAKQQPDKTNCLHLVGCNSRIAIQQVVRASMDVSALVLNRMFLLGIRAAGAWGALFRAIVVCSDQFFGGVRQSDCD
jgi:hypothetical protein